MATGRIPTTANSPLTTKGDLFGYSTTQARVAVGSDGDTLVADSAATTGLRWSPAPSTGNPVINSAFQIWQRGTSNVTTALAYTADRWQKGSGTFFGVSRQATSDTTNLPFIEYCARVQRTAGNSTTTGMDIAQNFESVNSKFFAGKTITISFYGRKGADYSATTSVVNLQLYTGTGTDQNIMTGFTGGSLVGSVSATLTTTWQRFTGTFTLSSSTNQMALYFIGTPTGTAGTNDYYEVTGVQVDVGSVALPFRTAGGTIQGELAACQRYAINLNYNPAGKAVYNTICNGYANSTTKARLVVHLPAMLRAQPTSITYSGAFGLDNITAVNTITALTINQAGTQSILLEGTVASGLTSGQNLTLYANNDSNAYILLNAEL